MTALPLAITALLAALDAALAARSLASGVPESGGIAWAQVFWMLASILVLLFFRSRGYWAGAPIAQIAYVAAGAFVYASVPEGSALFLVYRILGSAAVFAVAATSLRAVVTREADEGEAPRRVLGVTAAAVVLAAVGCGFAYRARELIVPAVTEAPVAAAPAERAERVVRVTGRVLRPDGVTFPGVTVSLVTEGLAARRFRVRGDATVRTDRLGRFAFEGTSSEARPACRLTFRVPGYKPKTVDAVAAAGAPGLDVVLSPDL